MRAEAALRASQIAPAKALEIAQRNEEKQLAAALLLQRWRGRKKRRFERGLPRPRSRAQCSRERPRKRCGGILSKGRGLCEKGAKSQIVKEKLLIQQERERVEAEKEREKRRAQLRGAPRLSACLRQRTLHR